MTNWIKYARCEENQQEFACGRSVYEGAIDVDHRNIPIWLKYAEMEMRHKYYILFGTVHHLNTCINYSIINLEYYMQLI